MAKITMQQSQIAKSIDDAFNDFIKYCKIKNLSPHTIEFYEANFEKFLRFCEGDLKDITSDNINDYILRLREQNTLNDVSINSNLRAIRAILYYFMQLGYVKKFQIKLVKAEKKVKETYTDQELEILLKEPNLKKYSFTTAAGLS